MNIIGTHHKFTNITNDNTCDNKSPQRWIFLNIFWKNIAIDALPLTIIQSTHRFNIRFILGACGKLYMLKYRKQLVQDSQNIIPIMIPHKAQLLHDTQISGINIKKISYNGKHLLILSECGHLYRYERSSSICIVINDNIRDIICHDMYYIMVNNENEILSDCDLGRVLPLLTRFNCMNPIIKFCFDCHDTNRKFICLTASGELVNASNTIAKNIKYFDFKSCHCPQPGNKHWRQNWIVFCDGDNIIYYGALGFHFSKFSLRDDVNILGVFINYYTMIMPYALNDDMKFINSRMEPMICYVTSDGIYEINRHESGRDFYNTDENLITKNISDYFQDGCRILRPIRTKSAIK